MQEVLEQLRSKLIAVVLFDPFTAASVHLATVQKDNELEK